MLTVGKRSPSTVLYFVFTPSSEKIYFTMESP